MFSFSAGWFEIPPAQQTTSYLHQQTHRLHPEPCVLEQLLAACRAEPEVFWCTAGKCVFVQKNHNDPEPPNITNQSVWETVLRERGGRGEEPCRRLQWDQHAVGFLPEGNRAGQTLSEMSQPLKGSLSCLITSQRRTRSEQACLVVGVCEHRQGLCVIVSAGCKDRYCWFFFVACLFIYMLAASPNVEQASDVFFFFSVVCLQSYAAEDRLREQPEMGWGKHEERPCALQKQRNAFDKDTAAS